MSFNPENFFLKRMGNCNFKVQYRNYNFSKAETKFGRGRDCDVILKNLRCSLYHCKITFENGKMFIEDFSSAGTFVNNVKIHGQKVELFEGAIVGMGANPNRQDHVDKTNFYIYKVQKIESPIILDSSDDEANQVDIIPGSKSAAKIDENQNVEESGVNAIIEKEVVENVNESSSKQTALKATTESKINNADETKTLNVSNNTVCLENNEHLQDLTQKIEEHLTANEGLKSKHIEMEIGSEIDQTLLRLRNAFSGKSHPKTSALEANCHHKENNSAARLNVSATATTSKAKPPADLQPEWISSSFISNSVPAIAKTHEESESKISPNQQFYSELESSDLPPEPPIFTPGPSNFQPFPLFLTESTSLTAFAHVSDQQQQLTIELLGLSETPNFLPSPSHLVETTTNEASVPSTSGRNHSNLALRKKSLSSSSSSSSTAPQVLNSTSVPSSQDQLKTLTPDELKSKTNFLRHYGQQTTKLIDLPEKPSSQASDLLDEVEGPKNTLSIFWKGGIAMVKTVKQPRKKRGRPPKSENANKTVKEDIKKSENSKNTESKILKSKNSGITSKSEKEESENKKNSNIDSENESSNSEYTSLSSNSTKLKATARKSTSSGITVTKRPFTSIGGRKSKFEDSNSSNEYQSAQSENSDSENQKVNEKYSKRLTTSKNMDESSKPNCDKLPKKEKLTNLHHDHKERTLIPTSSSFRQLMKFPDSDDENSKNLESGLSKTGSVKPRVAKIVKRRESIFKQRGFKRYIQTHKNELLSLKRSEIANQSTVRGSSSSLSGLAPQPNQNPESASPIKKYQNKFPHLYQSLMDGDTKCDSDILTAPAASVPMKKRRQSVFEEQAQLIPGNLTLNERSNAIRRWNQNTTKLIDIPQEDPNKKKRGRPLKCNENERIKMLVDKSRANEEKK